MGQPPSTVGTARVLALRGGVTIREEVVYWDPPHCYAYTAEGKRCPLRNYIGLMDVQAAAGGGGAFLFKEYFCVEGGAAAGSALTGHRDFGQAGVAQPEQTDRRDIRRVPARPGPDQP